MNSQNFKLFAQLSLTVFFMSCAHQSKNHNGSKVLAQPRTNAQNEMKVTSPLSSHQIQDQKIMQELTGQKSVQELPAKNQKLPLSTQHFLAGQRAAFNKNYIVAIKHFNTVIKKYPTSKDYQSALIAKSKVYQEMGLSEPAQLNLKMAKTQSVSKNKKTASQDQDQNKLKK